MKIASKTYHFISALVLVLFLSSTLLPVSISAASLFCGMDMSAMNHGDLSCCDAHEADHSEASISLDKTSCSYQDVCEQVLSDSQTSIEAVLQLTQNDTAVLLTQDISPGALDYSKTAFFQSKSVSPKVILPIFLLNSTFLN